MDSTDSNYISKVFGLSNFGKNRTDVPLFVEEAFPTLLNNSYNQGYIRGLNCGFVDLPGARSNDPSSIGYYLQKYQGAESPWVVSQLEGSKVTKLFKVYTISDGDSSNLEIKISILNISFNNGTFDVEKSVTPGRYGSPTYQNIYLDDGKGSRLLKSNSTATFSLYATLSSTDDTVSPFISDDGLTLYNIKYGINNLGLSNNVISLVTGGTGYSNNQSGNVSVSVSLPDTGTDRAQAVANVANGVIQNVYITYPGSGYLNTPTITIVDANTTPGTGATVNAVSEFSPKGGNSIARYVTKKVTLASGNDSQDLRVFFTAYRPVGTNIYVFYRIQNKNDSQTFENGNWQLMTYVNNNYGFSKSRGDMLEFEAAPGINGYANNQVSYVSTTGTTYTSFNQFAIKIVLSSSDTTNVPYLNDIRALALPSGTGL